jgi:hypothetical protein
MQVKTLLKSYKGPHEIHFVKKPWYKIVDRREEHRHYDDEIIKIVHTSKKLIIYAEAPEYELDNDEDTLPWY